LVKKVKGRVGNSLPSSYIKDMKETKDQTTYFKKSQLCHFLYGRPDDFLDLFADNIIYENGRTDNGKSLSELLNEDLKLNRIIL
jgi:hypothetical protein